MIKCNLNQITRDKHILPFKMEMHKHRFNELTYYISGKGTTQIGATVYDYENGSFAFTNSDTSHNEIDPVACDIIWLHFDYESDTISLKEGVFKDTDGSLLSTIKNLKASFHSQTEYKDEFLESQLSQVIVNAAILQLQNNSSTPNIDWQNILEFIDTNSHTDIDFKRLAKKYSYSYDRFRHIFKDIFGLSPNAYLLQRRIEHAKQLLKSTNLNLTDIAFDCGFNGSSQFSNTFRKCTGVTPKLYRNEKSNIVEN